MTGRRFDLEQTVPFGRALRAHGRPHLYLARPPANGQVSQPTVLGVPGTSRHDRGVAGGLGGAQHVFGPGDGPGLVRLDQDGISDVVSYSPPQPLEPGGEQVVTHQLAAVADEVPGGSPTGPVVLGQHVFQ